MAEEKKFYGTGRRKSSIARVYITAGKGKILVNGVEVEKYMPYATLVQNLKQPLVLTASESKYDIECEVEGGGFTGQAEAMAAHLPAAKTLDAFRSDESDAPIAFAQMPFDHRPQQRPEARPDDQ